jgi:hypothetical protein
MREPIGEVIAISRVNSYGLGTKSMVSPFFMLREACTPR